jgi:integrase
LTVRNLAPGRWELRVYAGLDPVTHKKRSISRTVHGTEREARKAERLLRVEVDKGKHAATEGTVAFLLEEWFAQASPRWSKRYAFHVRSNIDRRWIPAVGAKKLNRLEAIDLDRCYRRWEAEGLAPATIGQYHAAIRRALRQAVRWGWITANPASQASPPPLVAHQLIPPSAPQLKRVIAALSADPESLAFATFVRFAAASGARRGEVCALRADDFDATGVTIARSIGQVGKEWHVKDTKTHQARRISLDPATLLLVEAQLGRQAVRAAAIPTALVANPYVFSHSFEAAEPWRPDSITQLWRRIRKVHGLDGVRLHDLRHAVATDLLTAGVDVRTVAGRLGHANAATTLKVYAQWSPQRDVDAASILGARLDERDDAPVSDLEAE